MKNAGFPKSCFNGFGFRKSIQKSSGLYDGLIKSGAVMILDPNRADGKKPGTNSPFTNPLVDLANKVGKNLFDPVGFINNFVVDSNGVINPTVGIGNSGYVSVKAGTYRISGRSYTAQATYNANKQFISYTTTQPVTIPVDGFILFNLGIGDTIYAQIGSGYVAYSNAPTDTATGPFRIAEIDGSGVVQSILICVGGSCTPL